MQFAEKGYYFTPAHRLPTLCYRRLRRTKHYLFLMHTVELLLASPLEEHVRAVWRELAAAGLRSLASHQHPTNRPHVTLATADLLTPAVAPALTGLPVDIVLDDVVALGRTMAWRVRPTPDLLELQEQVWRALDGRERNPLHEPGRWVPHVSLALRVKPEMQDRYPRDLGPVPGQLVRARTYDSTSRTVADL